MTLNKSDILRLSTPELLIQRGRLAACVGDVEQVLLGSVVEQTRRCGKPGCRCAAGGADSAHGPYAYFSERRGRTGMRYVPRGLLGSVRAFLHRGEQVEAVLAEISAINVELLARRALR